MPSDYTKLYGYRTSSSDVVIVLGGSVMQLPMVHEVYNRGMTPLVFDGNPQALARQLCEHFFPIDLKDPEAMAQKASLWARENSMTLKAVVTQGTDFSHSVSLLAHSLHLPHLPSLLTRTLSHKGLMRDALVNAGLATVSYCWGRPEDVEKEVHNLEYPLVVKPCDNMGGRGTVLVQNSDGLSHALAQACQWSESSTVIAESFIQGREFSVDICWDGREISRWWDADRHIFMAPHFIELGHDLPSVLLNSSMRTSMASYLTTFLNHLNGGAGCYKADIFWTDRGPVLGELAARLSGGFMSGWTAPLAWGESPASCALSLALGESLDPVKTLEAPGAGVERSLAGFPGKLEELKLHKAIVLFPNISLVHRNRSVGQTLDLPQNNTQKVLHGVGRGATVAEAVRQLSTFLAAIEIVLEPKNKATDDYFLSEETWLFHDPLVKQWARDPKLQSIGTLVTRHKVQIKRPLYLYTNCENEEPSWTYRTRAEELRMLNQQYPGLSLATADHVNDPLERWLSIVFHKAGVSGVKYWLRSIE